MKKKSKKQNALQSKKQNEVIETYIENGIKITVYKSQYPRLEELTFPRQKEFIEYFVKD
jgi:predicted peroxiredoxin